MNWSIALGVSLAALGGLFIWLLMIRGGGASAQRLTTPTPPTFAPVSAFIKQPIPDGQERLATQAERDDVKGIIERRNTTPAIAYTPL